MGDAELLDVTGLAERFDISREAVFRLLRGLEPAAVRANRARVYRVCQAEPLIVAATDGLPVATPEMGELLPLYQLAARLGRGQDALRRWVRAGLLAPVARSASDCSARLYRLSDAAAASRANPPTEYGSSRQLKKRGQRPVPPEPTDVPPGPDRVAVYEQRYAGGYNLYHPLDIRADEGVAEWRARVQKARGDE